MFIRSLSVKVPMALLSCSSFVYMSQAKCAAYDLSGECLRIPIAASSSRKGERDASSGEGRGIRS